MSVQRPGNYIFSEHLPTAVPLVALAPLSILLLLCQGCSGSIQLSTASNGTSPSEPLVSLQPSSATIQEWQTIQFTTSGGGANIPCEWSTTNASIVSPIVSPEFQGVGIGDAVVSVTCGSQSAQAVVKVVPQVLAGPIDITSGGTYSGIWNSEDPGTPAVTIDTDDPVVVQDSIITGRGILIRVRGAQAGANVTIENVTGTANDPGIAGKQRGSFVYATNVNSLVVKNCTITGTSFGVYILSSTVALVQIMNNLGLNLDDRASDGQGGFLITRPSLGHFILLNQIVAPSGAEIGWNEDVQTMGQSSIEDVISIYMSQGTSSRPIWVHDNYIEGNSSPSTPTNYTGTGVISDGGTEGPDTAFAAFDNNDVVHTAGSGIMIASGHDISATGDRIVSCGQYAQGGWFAMGYVNAASIWDGYNRGPAYFYNNTMTGMEGGLVRPRSDGEPEIADLYTEAKSMAYPGNSASDNDFSNPCWTGGALDLGAEDAERAYWKQKVVEEDELIGDQHE